MQNSISKCCIFRKYSGGKICTERRGAQDILIRRFPAAETQRVQAVAVKLRL